jgi:GNAT superfamily N-acetyltransferase
MSLKIVRATVDMVDDLVALMQSAYRGEASRKGWTSEADFIDGTRTNSVEMTEAILDPDTYIIVAVNDVGQLIGCAAITREANSCNFGKFAVDPSLQGVGTGKLLLSAAEKAAVEHFGMKTMTMTVINGRTELEAFYERRGYVRTGNVVYMADIYTGNDMTIGLDLVLNEYAKEL